MDASSFNVNVLKEKPRIVNLLNMKGPCVAPSIAKQLNLNSFLASALLSELLHDKMIKTSTLRVGGGPLYYIPGQETLVENFVQYLPGKEKEAFSIIKKEEILEDSKQEPAIRVALRSIKDFAIPLKVYLNNEERLFWKLHTMGKEDFEKRINIMLNPVKEEVKTLLNETEMPKKNEEVKEGIKEEAEEKNKKKLKGKREKKPKQSFDFLVDCWIRENTASVIELSKDGKNAQGRITLPNNGEYLLIARNKKSLTELDLVIANQLGLNSNLPVILLANGKLSNKAEEIFSLFKNIILRKL